MQGMLEWCCLALGGRGRSACGNAHAQGHWRRRLCVHMTCTLTCHAVSVAWSMYPGMWGLEGRRVNERRRAGERELKEVLMRHSRPGWPIDPPGVRIWALNDALPEGHLATLPFNASLAPSSTLFHPLLLLSFTRRPSNPRMIHTPCHCHCMTHSHRRPRQWPWACVFPQALLPSPLKAKQHHSSMPYLVTLRRCVCWPGNQFRGARCIRMVKWRS